MFTNLMPNPKQQFFSNNGIPLVGGKVYTYDAGTSNPKATYSDEAGTVPQTNPIVLNIRGEPATAIRWIGSYRIEVRDILNNLIYTVDDFQAPTSPDELSANAGSGLIGFDYATVYPAGSLGRWLVNLALSAGSSFIGFIQAGGGAVLRTLQAKMRDTVSVKDFGATGDGVTNDTAAIKLAIASFGANAGKLFFPRGVYLVNDSLVVTLSGMQIEGESPSNTYISSAGGVFDLLRIAGAYCKVSGLQFRPGGNQICMRLYAAHCTVENNRFLASANNVGTAILLADTDPVTAAFVPGAYTHTIYNNVIGVAGFAFANAIDDGSTAGIQATKFQWNQILSDAPIRITRGGGNTYIGNLIQTSTGTAGVPAGIAIDLGANVTSEMIYGNYLEKFAYGTLARQLSNAYQVANVTGNHYDNCTTPFSSLGAYNYVFENTSSNTRFHNGWTMDFSSAVYAVFKNLGGTSVFGMDNLGNFVAGISNSTSHHIRKTLAQGGVILQVDGGARGSYFQTVDGAGGNGANTALNIGANGVTSRSINAGGTVNASGADYAEYMHKETGCSDIAKGQVIGIDASGKLTDKWANAVTFAVKSTDPSYVGGDNWAANLGARPTDPTALEVFEAAVEAARQSVDRVAFAGQAPVNVMGTTPGQYIVPTQDGTGIKGTPVTVPTFDQYRTAVGKVIAIEQDGRARIIVKVA